MVRSPRNACQIASAASRAPGSSTRVSRIARTALSADHRDDPADHDRDPDLHHRPPAVGGDQQRGAGEDQRQHQQDPGERVDVVGELGERRRATTGGRSRRSRCRRPPGICSASCGRSAWIAPRSTSPTSASVSVAVFASPLKIDAVDVADLRFGRGPGRRCRRRSRRRRPRSAAGRRSGPAWAFSTRSSVTLLAISALTASSSSAAVARSANSSESKSASVGVAGDHRDQQRQRREDRQAGCRDPSRPLAHGRSLPVPAVGSRPRR